MQIFKYYNAEICKQNIPFLFVFLERFPNIKYVIFCLLLNYLLHFVGKIWKHNRLGSQPVFVYLSVPYVTFSNLYITQESEETQGWPLIF